MKDATLFAVLFVLQMLCVMAMTTVGTLVTMFLIDDMGVGAAFIGVAAACATALFVYPAADEVYAGLTTWLGGHK